MFSSIRADDDVLLPSMLRGVHAYQIPVLGCFDFHWPG